MDSDSSGVSSPDSVSSVISVLTEEPSQLVTSTSASQQATLGNNLLLHVEKSVGTHKRPYGVELKVSKQKPGRERSDQVGITKHR
jgi:hypothetical protein